jgi:Flp pilus assembly protein CpaB
MKQSTIITAVVVLAVIGIAAYLYKQNKDKKAAIAPSKPNVAITFNRGGTDVPVGTATVSLNTSTIPAPVA